MRKILLMFLLLITTTSVVFATKTRTQGMGLGNFDWALRGLETYVYTNPAYAAKNSDRLYLESTGNAVNQTEGGLFADMFGATMGLYLGERTMTTFSSLYDTTGYTRQTNTALSGQALEASLGLTRRNFDLFFAKDLGNMSLGANLVFGIAQDSANFTNKQDDTTAALDTVQNSARSEMEIGLTMGMNMKIGGLLESIDAALSFGMPVVSNKFDITDTNVNANAANIRNNSETYETDGALNAALNLRANLNMGKTNTLHVNLVAKYTNDSSKHNAVEDVKDSVGTVVTDIKSQDAYERTGISVSLGLADQLKVNKFLGLYAGLDVQFNTNSKKNDGSTNIAGTVTYDTGPVDNTATTINVPVFIGMEGELTTSWAVRFGLVHQALSLDIGEDRATTILAADDTKVDTTTTTNNNIAVATTTFSVGASYKINKFRLDWLANIDILREGTFLVSGNPTDFATQIAATYYFGSTSSPSKNK